MASPQLENGYTKISNELLEAICKAKLSGVQSSVLYFIIRYTYGFERKSTTLSIGFIARGINEDKANVSRAVKKLTSFKIVNVYSAEPYKPKQIGINKNYEQWEVLKCCQNDNSCKNDNCQNDNRSVVNSTTQVLSILQPINKTLNKTLNKNNIYMQNSSSINSKNDIPKDKKVKPVKHKYGEYKNVLLSDEEMEKLKNEFPNDYTEWIERASTYCESHGKKYKNFLAVIRQWSKKEQNTNNKSTKDIKPMTYEEMGYTSF